MSSAPIPPAEMFALARRRLLSLPRHQCQQLLAQRSVGRLGIVTGSRPQIFPINYRVYDGGVVFRVGADGVLSGLSRPQPVAFQIDDIDEEHEVGWSVLLQGTSRPIRDSEEKDRVLALLQIPWAVGVRPRLIHVRADVLTGRRVYRVASDPAVRSKP